MDMILDKDKNTHFFLPAYYRRLWIGTYEYRFKSTQKY